SAILTRRRSAAGESDALATAVPRPYKGPATTRTAFLRAKEDHESLTLPVAHRDRTRARRARSRDHRRHDAGEGRRNVGTRGAEGHDDHPGALERVPRRARVGAGDPRRLRADVSVH